MNKPNDLLSELEEYRETQPSDLDMRRTAKNIEMLVTAYKREAVKAGLRASPKVTPSYSIMPPSFGNDFHSSTETAALDNIEKFEKVDYFVSKINQGLQRIDCVLDPDRRARRRVIFVDKFVSGNSKVEILDKLKIEHTTYHIELNMAIVHFACELGIEKRI